MEEAGEEVASVVAGIGHNAGTFILSTKNVDDDAGFANIQKVRFSEPSLRRTVEQNTDDDQSAEANEAPPVRRLDGEVVRTGEMPFSGGMHFEVWTGRWEKGGKKKSGGEVNGEKIDDKEASGEKVGSGFVVSILLMWFFVGRLEDFSSIQVTGESAQGFTVADRFCAICSYPSPGR